MQDRQCSAALRAAVFSLFLWCRARKAYMARLTLGPRGSVNEPSQWPPDQACPSPSTVQYFCTTVPAVSVHRRTRYDVDRNVINLPEVHTTMLRLSVTCGRIR